MTSTEFTNTVEESLTEIRARLIHKGNEYANEVDRLSNFNEAGKQWSEHPIAVWVGYYRKHQTSVMDLLAKFLRHGQLAIMAIWEEKIYDMICYLIILRALLKQEINRG